MKFGSRARITFPAGEHASRACAGPKAAIPAEAVELAEPRWTCALRISSSRTRNHEPCHVCMLADAKAGLPQTMHIGLPLIVCRIRAIKLIQVLDAIIHFEMNNRAGTAEQRRRIARFRAQVVAG